MATILAKAAKGVQALIPLLLAAACVLACAFHIAGFRVYAVQTGSMAPTIPTGSLVVVDRGIEKDALKAGQILAFQTNSGTLVTHRALSINKQAGLIQTKGDANPSKDPAPIDTNQVVGVVIGHAPFLGFIPLFLGTLPLPAKAALTALPMALLVALWAKGILKNANERNEA